MSKLAALGYYGGKSATANQALALDRIAAAATYGCAVS